MQEEGVQSVAAQPAGNVEASRHAASTSAPGSRSTSPAKRQGSVPLASALPTSRVGECAERSSVAPSASSRIITFSHNYRPAAIATLAEKSKWNCALQRSTGCGRATGTIILAK